MKTWFKDTLFVFLEVIVGLLMIALFILVSIVGFFYTLIKHLVKQDYSAKRQFKPIMRSFTLIWDCFANASGGELLNDVSGTKENEIKYGNWNQTISSVTGLRLIFNQKDFKLRKFLDFFQKDHCENAPTEMEVFYYKNNIAETPKKSEGILKFMK